MHITYSENQLKVILNRNETVKFLNKTGKISNKSERIKNLNTIYKKALIKIDKFPTNCVSKIQIYQANNNRCIIIYKTPKNIPKNFKRNIYLYTTKNCEQVLSVIEQLYNDKIFKSELYKYKNNYYLLCETKEEPLNFKLTNIYVKAHLEEYAKLISNNAVAEIGYYFKNF